MARTASGPRARRIFAEDLATELDIDMSSEYMAAVDALLARLYLSGYVIAPIQDDPIQDNGPEA